MTDEIKKEPMLRTKLHRPPIARDHVHRGNVLSPAEPALHRPLFLVSAPTGYGKSTVVSCWLEANDILSAWLALDEDDNDLWLFLSILSPRSKAYSPQLALKRCPCSRQPICRRFSVARSLINELEQIEKTFILVLDDYHLIREKRIHRNSAKLLEHPSAFMHLVLIGRRNPSLPLASLRAKGQMIEIGIQDLRFSLDETAVSLNY